MLVYAGAKVQCAQTVLAIRSATRMIMLTCLCHMAALAQGLQGCKKCPGSRALSFAAKMATDIYAVLRASVPSHDPEESSSRTRAAYCSLDMFELTVKHVNKQTSKHPVK